MQGTQRRPERDLQSLLVTPGQLSCLTTEGTAPVGIRNGGCPVIRIDSAKVIVCFHFETTSRHKLFLSSTIA